MQKSPRDTKTLTPQRHDLLHHPFDCSCAATFAASVMDASYREEYLPTIYSKSRGGLIPEMAQGERAVPFQLGQKASRGLSATNPWADLK